MEDSGGKALEDYKIWIESKARSKSPHTVRRLVRVANDFVGWFQLKDGVGQFDVSDVTEQDLLDWKSYLLHDATYRKKKDSKPQSYSISSVNSSIKNIKVFFEFYKEVGKIPVNPAERLKPHKGQAGHEEEIRWLDESEKSRLLNYLNNPPLNHSWRHIRNLAIMYCCLYAGMRVSEIVEAEIEDLDFKNRYISIPDRRGEKATRRIEMNEDLRIALLNWIKERGQRETDRIFVSQKGLQGFTEQGVEHIFRTVSVQVEIPDLRPHVLRHTMAHDLLVSGVSPQRISMLLGYSTVESTRKYTRSMKRKANEENNGE